MILGAGVAVLLRIIFTGIVVTLMALPFRKLVGGLAPLSFGGLRAIFLKAIEARECP
jgi:hypothetical protein